MHHALWQWWALAAVLLIMEVIVPGTFFLWLGIAAALVGVAVWLLPSLDISLAWALFAGFSVVSVLFWLKLRKVPQGPQSGRLNKRGQELVGRAFTLDEPIENGYGKIQIGDTLWTLRGADAPAATTVKVIGVESGVLRVVNEGPATG